MRKPTASGRRNERSRAAAMPRRSTKETVAKSSGKAAARRSPGESRTVQARGDGRMPERRATEKVIRRSAVAPGAAASGSASRGKYVYCIIEASDPLKFGPVGIGTDPAEVYTVHFKNLAAVVSDADAAAANREDVAAMHLDPHMRQRDAEAQVGRHRALSRQQSLEQRFRFQVGKLFDANREQFLERAF